MSSKRQNEVGAVQPEHRDVWLAGQIDEVEDRLLSEVANLSDALSKNTEQVKNNTDEQIRTRDRLTWLIVTALVAVLITITAGGIAGVF